MAEATDKELIRKFMKKLKDDLLKELPRATGRSIDSLEVFEENGNSYILRGNHSLLALEEGRKPTAKNAKQSMPTLRERILEWVTALRMGISESERESMSFAITKSIHKKGTLMHQKGSDIRGKSHYLSNIVNDGRINKLVEKLEAVYSYENIFGNLIK